jgi:hypothetical protein
MSRSGHLVRPSALGKVLGESVDRSMMSFPSLISNAEWSIRSIGEVNRNVQFPDKLSLGENG